MKHPREFLHGDTRMVYVPVKLHWSYRGESGIADHQAIAMVDEYTGEFCLSDFWWFEGNGGCDCNRVSFCGLTPEDFPALYWKVGDKYPDGQAVGPSRELKPRCGHDIYLTKIESLDPLIPSLEGEVTEQK